MAVKHCRIHTPQSLPTLLCAARLFVARMLSQLKRKRLGGLAEDYLVDSDASVRVVVGLDIEYGRKWPRKATLSV